MKAFKIISLCIVLICATLLIYVVYSVADELEVVYHQDKITIKAKDELW